MKDDKSLGLKIGLEIHRQISSHKLFCSCKSELEEGKPQHIIKRSLHDVSSEVGEKDVVAQYEKMKKKYAIYEVMDEGSCAVEIDEEPIHAINNDALHAVLEVALLLHCTIINPMQIMRKQVLDYSNTSGFQRTVLAALDGYVETKSGKVRIASICVEEDSARRIKTEKDYVVFRLDRLGIPLIEIATAPDITSPEQAQEVAAHFGMILKSTGKFRSGIGTIRQDLNVSITSHPRVEIKGVQELRLIPEAVKKEIARQQENILQKKMVSEVRQMQEDGSTKFLRPMPGAARMYVETDHPLIFIDEEELKKIKLPELVAEKTLRLEKQYNLSPQLAREIADDALFETYVARFKHIEPNFLAQVLLEMPKEIKTRFKLDPAKLRETDYAFVLEHYDNKVIPKSAILEILVELCQGKKVDLTKYQAVSEEALDAEVQHLVAVQKDASIQALMGMLMGKYRGKVDGQNVMKLLQKYKNK